MHCTIGSSTNIANGRLSDSMKALRKGMFCRARSRAVMYLGSPVTLRMAAAFILST